MQSKFSCFMVTLNKKTYATLALVAAGILGGLVPIAVKLFFAKFHL